MTPAQLDAIKSIVDLFDTIIGVRVTLNALQLRLMSLQPPNNILIIRP